jgi:hypothetical protein
VGREPRDGYARDAARGREPDLTRERAVEPRREPARGREPVRGREREPTGGYLEDRPSSEPRRRPPSRELEVEPTVDRDRDRGRTRREPDHWTDEWDDRSRPQTREWEDSRAATVARAPSRARHDDLRYDDPRYDDPRYDDPRYDDPRYDDPRYDDPRYDDPRDRLDRPDADAADADASPWDDDAPVSNPDQPSGSLRRAGRPKRKDVGMDPRDVTGSGSYRTGSAPRRSSDERSGSGSQARSSGSSSGSGLRLGRKPKRRP